MVYNIFLTVLIIFRYASLIRIRGFTFRKISVLIRILKLNFEKDWWGGRKFFNY